MQILQKNQVSSLFYLLWLVHLPLCTCPSPNLFAAMAAYKALWGVAFQVLEQLRISCSGPVRETPASPLSTSLLPPIFPHFFIQENELHY